MKTDTLCFTAGTKYFVCLDFFPLLTCDIVLTDW